MRYSKDIVLGLVDDQKIGTGIVWLCGGWIIKEFGIEIMEENMNITPAHQ